MFISLYSAGALFVFSMGLKAFLKDTSTPKTHVMSWLVLGVATALWPVVLPSMLRAKLASETVENDTHPQTDCFSQRLENSI